MSKYSITVSADTPADLSAQLAAFAVLFGNKSTTNAPAPAPAAAPSPAPAAAPATDATAPRKPGRPPKAAAPTAPAPAAAASTVTRDQVRAALSELMTGPDGMTQDAVVALMQEATGKAQMKEIADADLSKLMDAINNLGTDDGTEPAAEADPFA